MISSIVVPLDGSKLADRAIPYAARLAGPLNARLLLVRILSTDEQMPDANNKLATVRERLSSTGISAQIRLSTGHPGSNIIDLANREPGSMIVMSTHGRSGLSRWLHGCVADDVLRRANVPVVLIPAECRCDWGAGRPLRILVPLDGSQFSEQACKIVPPMAHSLHAEVILLRVVDPSIRGYTTGLIGDTRVPPAEIASAQSYLVTCARAEDWRAISPILRTVVGHPDSAIAKVVLDFGVDLIAMATHGRSGLSRLVLGSVANLIVREANVPVLLTKSREIVPISEQSNDLRAS